MIFLAILQKGSWLWRSGLTICLPMKSVGRCHTRWIERHEACENFYGFIYANGK